MNKEQLKESVEGHVVRTDDCMMNQNVIPLEVIKVLIDQLEEPEIIYEKALNKLAEHLPMTSNQVSDHLGNLVSAGGNCTYGIIKELSKLEKYKEQELKITGLTNMDLEELTAKLVTGNYIIKKEPKWIITDGENAYLYDFILREDEAGFAEKKKEAIKFDSKEKAEAINVFVGGTVEELEMNE